jgi:hypothetical protein
MMDYNTAQNLLDRYFDGETSVAEETSLRSYFQSGSISSDHQEYAPLFAYWAAAAEVKAPPVRKPKARLRSLRWMAAAAAAVLLLLVANNWCNRQAPISDTPFADAQEQPAKTVDWSKYEISADEDGYRKLRGALKTVSTALNDSPKATLRELDKMSATLR